MGMAFDQSLASWSYRNGGGNRDRMAWMRNDGPVKMIGGFGDPAGVLDVAGQVISNWEPENRYLAMGLGLFAAVALKKPGLVKAEGWLAYHEGSALGHTLARHVGKTDADLISRLATQRRITGASSFTNEAIAESVISSTIKSNRGAIKSWLRSGMTNSLRLEYSGSTNIGRGIMRTTNVVNDLTNARVILKSNGNGGYFILTSFPR